MLMKSDNFNDLLWSVADEIDAQYKDEELLCSVQSIDDIQSIFSFGMHFAAFYIVFPFRTFNEDK